MTDLKDKNKEWAGEGCVMFLDWIKADIAIGGNDNVLLDPPNIFYTKGYQ